jgi:hypothetical protein
MFIHYLGNNNIKEVISIMIYVFDPRKTIKPEKRAFDFGDIYQLSFGEKGRGRKLISLTCPEDCVLINGMNKYSIGFTKSGKPRIVGDDGNLYLILSAQGGYTRRGNGTIEVPITEIRREKAYYDSEGKKNHYDGYYDNINTTCLALGNGADGDAGRIGYWDVAILTVVGSNTIRVRTSGGGYGTDPDYFVINNKTVNHIVGNEALQDAYDNGLEIPNFWTKFFNKNESVSKGFINITNPSSGINGLHSFIDAE